MQTTLPTNVRETRSGYNEEVRISFPNGSQLSGSSSNNMSAQVQYQDVVGQTPAYQSQFNIDTYWLNSDNNPTNHGLSGGGNGSDGRDNMDKMCFNQGSHSYSRPAGSNYNC